MNKQSSIFAGLLIAAFGVASGALTNSWLSAGRPGLIATNVDFRKVEGPGTKLLILDQKIRELARTSSWIENLKETMSASDLQKNLDNAEKTQSSLIATQRFIPAALKRLRAVGQRNFVSWTVSFFGDDIDKASDAEATIDAEITGDAVRGNLKPTNVGLPAAWDPTSAAGRKSLELIIAGRQSPDVEIKVYQRALETMGSEARAIGEVVSGLKALQAKDSADRTKEYFYLDAIYSDYGGRAVSMDKFVAVAVVGLDHPLLLSPIDDTGAIVVRPGESRVVHLRSVEPLKPKESERLHKLYETDVVTFRFVTRNLSASWWQSRWVESSQAKFSSYSEQVQTAYDQKAASLLRH